MNLRPSADNTVFQLILKGDWKQIEEYAYPTRPWYMLCDHSVRDACRDALDVYENYLGYSPSEVILDD